MLIGFHNDIPVTNSGTGGKPTREVEAGNRSDIPFNEIEWAEFLDDSSIAAKIQQTQRYGGWFKPVKNGAGDIIDVWPWPQIQVNAEIIGQDKVITATAKDVVFASDAEIIFILDSREYQRTAVNGIAEFVFQSPEPVEVRVRSTTGYGENRVVI